MQNKYLKVLCQFLFVSEGDITWLISTSLAWLKSDMHFPYSQTINSSIWSTNNRRNMSKCHYYLAPSSTSAINGSILPPSRVPWRKINCVKCLWQSVRLFSALSRRGDHAHIHTYTLQMQTSPLNSQSVLPEAVGLKKNGDKALTSVSHW